MDSLTRLGLATLALMCLTAAMVNSAHAAISSAERQALIALYNSTNGDAWTDNSGWKTGGSFSPSGTEDGWYGIGCTGNTVTAITLHENQLNGTIPAALENLPCLQYLALSGNQLQGAIPTTLGNLHHLTILYLFENQLSGVIPTALGNLPYLVYLCLRDNQLSGTIPAALGNLHHLQFLDLNNNQLNGPIPTELKNLTSLIPGNLDICNNYLYTNDAALIAFLNTKAPGWESCQAPVPSTVPPCLPNDKFALCIGVRVNSDLAPDFRGDLAAADIAERFSGFMPTNHIIILQGEMDSGGVTKMQVQEAIGELKNKGMKSGDFFFMYLTGHGASNTNPGGESTANPGDECVRIGPATPGGLLTDDDLYSYLSGMSGVNKWITIDACHSGGFWGNNDPGDAGDLEKLNKTSLIAAAAEEGEHAGATYLQGITSYGIFTYALRGAFEFHDGKLKSDKNRDGVLTVSELDNYLDFWVGAITFDGTTMYEMEFGDPVVFTQNMWFPQVTYTSDFDAMRMDNTNISPIIYLLLR